MVEWCTKFKLSNDNAHYLIAFYFPKQQNLSSPVTMIPTLDVSLGLLGKVCNSGQCAFKVWYDTIFSSFHLFPVKGIYSMNMISRLRSSVSWTKSQISASLNPRISTQFTYRSVELYDYITVFTALYMMKEHEKKLNSSSSGMVCGKVR